MDGYKSLTFIIKSVMLAEDIRKDKFKSLCT